MRKVITSPNANRPILYTGRYHEDLESLSSSNFISNQTLDPSVNNFDWVVQDYSTGIWYKAPPNILPFGIVVDKTKGKIVFYGKIDYPGLTRGTSYYQHPTIDGAMLDTKVGSQPILGYAIDDNHLMVGINVDYQKWLGPAPEPPVLPMFWNFEDLDWEFGDAIYAQNFENLDFEKTTVLFQDDFENNINDGSVIIPTISNNYASHLTLFEGDPWTEVDAFTDKGFQASNADGNYYLNYNLTNNYRVKFKLKVDSSRYLRLRIFFGLDSANLTFNEIYINSFSSRVFIYKFNGIDKLLLKENYYDWDSLNDGQEIDSFLDFTGDSVNFYFKSRPVITLDSTNFYSSGKFGIGNIRHSYNNFIVGNIEVVNIS